MKFTVLAGLAGLLTYSQALPTPEANTVVCPTTGISSSRAAQVSQAFTNAKLSPQVVPNFTPKVEVNVAFGAKAANLGTVYSTAETLIEPTISFTAESDQNPSTTKYVILFVDPDAPAPNPNGTPASLSPFLHLAVYDASPNCVNPANYGGGKTLAMYKALTPLSVANHRYTQLVYRQPAGFTPPLSISYVAGALFDLNGFVSQGRLTLVGGNYLLEGLGSLGSIGK